MKHKFWFSYLALVLLFSGLAYVAISDDADVPLALSDSEMAVLRGTALLDYKCITNASSGCPTTNCSMDPFGIATEGVDHNDCRYFPEHGHTCNFKGLDTAQTTCRKTKYKNNCDEVDRVLDPDTIQDCK